MTAKNSRLKRPGKSRVRQVSFGLPFIIAGQSTGDRQSRDFDSVIKRNARELVEQGRQIFRFDTFGDEEF